MVRLLAWALYIYVSFFLAKVVHLCQIMSCNCLKIKVFETNLVQNPDGATFLNENVASYSAPTHCPFGTLLRVTVQNLSCGDRWIHPVFSVVTRRCDRLSRCQMPFCSRFCPAGKQTLRAARFHLPGGMGSFPPCL